MLNVPGGHWIGLTNVICDRVAGLVGLQTGFAFMASVLMLNFKVD
jgi:hypothetical protein